MDKFKGKYRAETARLKGWNYGAAGYYFVTICEKNRNRVFGDIVNATVSLSALGLAAKECWLEIPEHFPFVELDAFCIMPNHIHGIILIDNHDSAETQIVETQDFASLRKVDRASAGFVETQASLQKVDQASAGFVETQDFASLQKTGNKFGPQSKNLASVVRGFKIGVTKYARANDIPMEWQPRYHDRIIRDEKELFAVRNYIYNNPLEWALDEYATDGRDAKFCVSTGGDSR